jgi:type I restriction enzyme S subunit
MTAIRGGAGCPPAFLVEALRSSTVRRDINAKTDHGTVLSALNVRTIPDLLIPAGNVEVRRTFQRRVGPLHQMQDALLAENTHMAGVRNDLLPRLLSGEIRVRDVKALVEEAV